MDRRRFLHLLRAGLVVSAASSSSILFAAKPKRQPAALLVPLTGASASLGISMQRAALLAQPPAGQINDIVPYDTGGTPDGAVKAAQLALKNGSRIILGPLFASEVRGVTAAVAGRVPVMTFSNDEALRDSGAFLLGITATQVTTTILGYARSRGVRRVTMLVSATPWSMQVAAAATRLAGQIGLTVTTAASADLAALRQAAGGELPDALYVADGGDIFATAARLTQGSGIQLLGTLQASDAGLPVPPGGAGAWIAAPDPDGLADFAQTYEQRNGGGAGDIAALAYDAAGIANALRASARLDRAGLLQPAGFPAITGAVHFREDGSATRDLVVLIADATGFSVAPA